MRRDGNVYKLILCVGIVCGDIICGYLQYTLSRLARGYIVYLHS